MVIRIDMNAGMLLNTRFAISPLHTLVDSLWLIHWSGQPRPGGWSALMHASVRERRLTLLRAIFTGQWKYVPDFISPQPESHEDSLERQLHAVAAVDPERLAQELVLMFDGDVERGVRGGTASRPLLDAIDRGESEFAGQVAAELDQLWRTAIRPHWPELRGRIEADIARRGQLIARHGLGSVIGGLHPRMMWGDDHLRLITDFHGQVCEATSLTLTPSVFGGDLQMTIDPLPGPGQRQPLLVYPADPDPGNAQPPSRPTFDLIGVTRARILSDLGTPRTTTELAERHWIAASTVSYHLGVLHRSGLVVRTRAQHRVLYQQSPNAGQLL
ncbi:ArsR/SmtB family transcription factor [Kitasatospora sp. NPDC092948]|uniref:ArsR/SmtB family transcription factor n=1 Tax=Kitasatospora sp. NPDC092948 TaxID=3364088 RepID=UPI0037FDF8FB